MKVVLVGSETGNSFMNELLDAVAFELAAGGVSVESALGRFPDDDDAVFVVIPHELFATIAPSSLPSESQLDRTISLATEQPGSDWFETSAAWCARVGATFDINPAGAAELGRRGVQAQRFQLGYTSYWDRWNRDQVAHREVDIIHMGTETYRRLSALASYASELWDRRTRILLPPVAPKPRGRQDYLVGLDKWDALASAKILLNIHRQPGGYLEWVRVLEAVCNGAVVVTETVIDASPLEQGVHYVSGPVDNLAGLCCALLDEPERLEAIRQEAYRFVVEELPLSAAAMQLANKAESLLAERVRPRRASSDLLPHRTETPLESPIEEPLKTGLISNAAVLKALVLGQMELRRELQALRVTVEGHSQSAEMVARTPTFRARRPRVSVVIPLRNHASDVGRALASVAGSEFEDLEVLVLDDGSTDDSLEVVRDFLERHPQIPGMLAQHRVNRGVAPTRNELVSLSQGELVFALDADNEIYPTALGRLVGALDDAPGAWFAYTMLEVHDGNNSRSLISYQPWDAERLREGNYIDAMALIRRSRLVEIGGYTTDIRLYGWEDYDLWCTVADHDGFGVLVPEILGRYQSGGTSMISITNIDWSEAQAVLRERHGWPAADS